MRLILVRHGETDHNRGNITLGRADVPLNVRGIAQARALAASFVRAPAAIYSSPLARAKDTASTIGRATGIGITIDATLIEMNVGEMEHLSRTELRARYPDFLAAWISDAAPDARMPGGETLREVQARAWPAVERMRLAHPDGDVVAVSHNFVILTIICRAIGLPLAQFRQLRHEVGARSTIDLNAGGAILVELNARPQG